MRQYILCAVAALLLATCLTGCLGNDNAGDKATSPEAVLSIMAKALSNKDAPLFLSQFDLPRYANAATEKLMHENAPLSMLDSVGKSLGLGSIQGLVGLVTGTEEEVKGYFERHVATGELVQQCTRIQTPDCPWVPKSLTDAVVKKLSPTTAVAGVTTPANILSWLAFAKVGDVWKLVGAAAMEQDAARYAQAAQSISAPPPASSDAVAPPPPASSSPSGAHSGETSGGGSRAPMHDEPAPPPPPASSPSPEKPVRL